MPQTLERTPHRLRRIIPSNGRELPRIVGYNENHDEAGRFAEGSSEGASAIAKAADKTASAMSLNAFAGRDASAHRDAAKALKETAKLHEAAAKAHDAASAAASGKIGIGGEVEHRVFGRIHRESARASKTLANAHVKRARYLDAMTP